MLTQIAAIVLLAAMFIIATLLPINMGALALVGAFIIGLISHLQLEISLQTFPAISLSRWSASLTCLQ